MHNHTEFTNFHVLIVKYIGPSYSLPSRIKIISERFKEAVVFSYNGDQGHTIDQAENWLIRNGHNVIGHAEGKGHYYVICGHISGSFTKLKQKIIT